MACETINKNIMYSQRPKSLQIVTKTVDIVQRIA